MGETEVTSEIERYIVAPGQACAYKVGMLKIQELRAHAPSGNWERNSTSANSTMSSSRTAPCRSKSWKNRSTPTWREKSAKR